MRQKKSVKILKKIFPDQYDIIYSKILANAKKYRFVKQTAPLSHKDVVLILYGDNFFSRTQKPLKALFSFLKRYASGIVSYVHILPFFPYSSDDGFSVIDYRKVNKKLGDWRDISRVGKSFNLMFDFVLNHVSAKSEWFKGYLSGNRKFCDYFIRADRNCDVSMVVRPRSHPLLSEFVGKNNERVKVWTTFSADQIDLNFKNPEVFIEMTDVFLFYLSRGARIIRLDAIAYLWKENGTKCIHLEKTHLYVKFLRALLNELKIGALIITETNVPHRENISYFGEGDEAHMVYQFPLPPLLAHALIREDISLFNKWLKSLVQLKKGEYFFNFTASHDGVGVRPLSGLVKDSEIDFMVKKTLNRGGYVSYKKNPDGSESPYELNISYINLINPNTASLWEKAARFMVSQFIMLSLKGVPGIYIHSFIGSQNYPEGVKRTGQKRAINRQKLDFKLFEKEMCMEESLRKTVYERYAELLRARKTEIAFHPDGSQKVFNIGKKAFALAREYKNSEVFCVGNITARKIKVRNQVFKILRCPLAKDIISGKEIKLRNFEMKPFEIFWLKPQ